VFERCVKRLAYNLLVSTKFIRFKGYARRRVEILGFLVVVGLLEKIRIKPNELPSKPQN